MFKSLKSKIVAGCLTAILALPSLVLGASVSITLKDHLGVNLTNYAGVKVTIEDGFGSVIHEGTPTSNPVVIGDLAPYNNYTVSIEQTKSAMGKEVKSVSKKSLSFASENETIMKNIYLPKIIAENVLVRMVGMPTDWSQATLELIPVNTSTVRHNYTNITKTENVVSGQAETVLAAIPGGSFQWKITNAGTVYNSKSNVFMRDNATVFINVEAVNDQTITMNFNLRNADRSPATFSGETINVVVKNDKNETVVSSNQTLNAGETHQVVSPALPQGSYSMTATMTKDGITKTYTRNFYLGNSARVINLNPVKISSSDITFFVKDNRTGATIANGTYKIMRRDNSIVDQGSFSGGSFTRSLPNGSSFIVEVEAPEYSKRTTSIRPEQNASRDINLVKPM